MDGRETDNVSKTNLKSDLFSAVFFISELFNQFTHYAFKSYCRKFDWWQKITLTIKSSFLYVQRDLYSLLCSWKIYLFISQN